MDPWIIAASCALGAALIAFGSAWLGMRWPLTALAVMLAVIAFQLSTAAHGDDGIHDLSAYRAMTFTVIPALAGVVVGLIAAETRSRRYAWKGWVGGLTLLALAVAVGAAGWTVVL